MPDEEFDPMADPMNDPDKVDPALLDDEDLEEDDDLDLGDDEDLEEDDEDLEEDDEDLENMPGFTTKDEFGADEEEPMI